jgi:putative ABC transport system ATP-binding protein
METRPQILAPRFPHTGHREGVPTTILLEGVCRRYDGGATAVTALDAVDLEVDEGEFVVVLGPSGSGKTTLLNIVGALDIPTAGEVTVDGQRVTHVGRRELSRFRREHVSFIFQSFNLFPGLTALENVRFGVDVTGRADGGAEAKARRVLDDVGLGDRADHFPHELSGGEQQRVAIARALGTGNSIILADEPTGELDFRTGVQILALLRAQAEAGKTVLVVTHNREISRSADRVVELSSGHVVSDGPPPGGRAEVSELHW